MKVESRSVESAKGVVTLYTVTNNSGASVVLTNVGAGIVAINVPDRDGKIADVAMGYEDPLAYFYDGPCSGKIPGRYAGRIAKGHLCIDGKDYQLAINNGPNALHGGPEGFQNQIWKGKPLEDGVEFSYMSVNGEEHYPGNMSVKALYTWSEDNTLTLRLYATTDAKTVINLTNHVYFNLGGHDSGTSLDHLLKLNARHYVPTDETLVPYGHIDAVEGTPMDFTYEHPIRTFATEDFPALKYGKGYDNSWVIEGWERNKISRAAELTDPVSGRKLTVSTDQPIVHVYNGNWISGSPAGKGGYEYHDYDTVAIECQDYPDAPNHPDFPSVLLLPGEFYARTIVFNFSTVK